MGRIQPCSRRCSFWVRVCVCVCVVVVVCCVVLLLSCVRVCDLFLFLQSALLYGETLSWLWKKQTCPCLFTAAIWRIADEATARVWDTRTTCGRNNPTRVGFSRGVRVNPAVWRIAETMQLASLAARYLEKKTRRFFWFFSRPPPSCFPRFTRGWPDDGSKQALRIKKNRVD